MQVTIGTVVGGKVVYEGATLAEGSVVPSDPDVRN